jgi:hypothetical protein
MRGCDVRWRVLRRLTSDHTCIATIIALQVGMPNNPPAPPVNECPDQDHTDDISAAAFGDVYEVVDDVGVTLQTDDADLQRAHDHGVECELKNTKDFLPVLHNVVEGAGYVRACLRVCLLACLLTCERACVCVCAVVRACVFACESACVFACVRCTRSNHVRVNCRQRCPSVSHRSTTRGCLRLGFVPLSPHAYQVMPVSSTHVIICLCLFTLFPCNSCLDQQVWKRVAGDATNGRCDVGGSQPHRGSRQPARLHAHSACRRATRGHGDDQRKRKNARHKPASSVLLRRKSQLVAGPVRKISLLDYFFRILCFSVAHGRSPSTL